MAEIRNTFIPNRYGDGNVKEVKCDNGDIYHIQNTFVPNRYGDGYEQEIVKVGSNNRRYGAPATWGECIWQLISIGIIAIVGFGVAFVGIPWFFISMFGY